MGAEITRKEYRGVVNRWGRNCDRFYCDPSVITKFLALCGTLMFITVIKTARHLQILLLLFHRAFFVHLVFSPTYALIYIIKILSQAITLITQFIPTCFDPYGSSSGSTAGPS